MSLLSHPRQQKSPETGGFCHLCHLVSQLCVNLSYRDRRLFFGVNTPFFRGVDAIEDDSSVVNFSKVSHLHGFPASLFDFGLVAGKCPPWAILALYISTHIQLK